MAFLLTLLLALGGLQAPAATGTAAIEGVVTRAGTSQPIEKVRVVVVSDQGWYSEAMTDGNGRYVVSNLPAGIFYLSVEAEGYFDNYSKSSTRVRLGLSDRQRLRHDAALFAVSSISGRIVDDNREPVAEIRVELLRQSHDSTGRVIWRSVASAVTDETGAYRFEDLPSGEFYIRASQKPLDAVPDLNSAEIAKTFFPGVLDPRGAAAISLRDGDRKTAEFSLAKGRTFAIAGTIKNADESRLQRVMLFALPQDRSIPLDEFFPSGVSVDEKFELKGLLPGSYDLLVLSFASNQSGSDSSRENSPARAAKGFVQIRDEDVRDLRFSLETSGDVSGRIKFVGKSVPLPGLQLTLTRRDFVKSLTQLGVLESPESFRFSGAVPGVYDVQVRIPGGNAYVADVRVLGRSIVDDGLTVGQDAVDSLEVWLDVEGGIVRGSVTSPKKLPAVVVLAPQASRRQSPTLFRTIVLDDPSEPFVLSSVLPGLYSLFAFELGSIDEVLPILSPDFLSLYQSKSISINIEKGATVTPAPLSLISR
jgi:hypothetical protein